MLRGSSEKIGKKLLKNFKMRICFAQFIIFPAVWASIKTQIWRENSYMDNSVVLCLVELKLNSVTVSVSPSSYAVLASLSTPVSLPIPL